MIKSKIEHREFVDLISHTINEHKHGAFVKSEIKRTMPFAEAKSVLEQKRTALNRLLANILKKYDILPSYFYDVSDEHWEYWAQQATISDAVDYINQTDMKNISKKLSSLVLALTSPVWKLIINSTKITWNGYLKRMKHLAIVTADAALDQNSLSDKSTDELVANIESNRKQALKLLPMAFDTLDKQDMDEIKVASNFRIRFEMDNRSGSWMYKYDAYDGEDEKRIKKWKRKREAREKLENICPILTDSEFWLDQLGSDANDK